MLYATTKKLVIWQVTGRETNQGQASKFPYTVDEQLTRGAEYFKELLNPPPPDDPSDILPPKDTLLLKCHMPEKAEIKKAIKMLKNGKAAGPDRVPAKALKVYVTSTAYLRRCGTRPRCETSEKKV